MLLGELAPEQRSRALGQMGALVSFTSPFDLTGQPAISLPLHWNADGFRSACNSSPRYGREDVLLRVARATRSRAHRGPIAAARLRLTPRTASRYATPAQLTIDASAQIATTKPITM